MAQTAIDLGVTPKEYFREKVHTALEQLKVSVDDQIEFYVVNLLCDFIDPQRLTATKGEGDLLETPLALLLKQAIESPPAYQVKLFKRLGDFSLYFAGFFQDFFNRKTYDVDYYISMGSTAYTSVSTIMRDRHRDDHFTEMYKHLAENFGPLVDVVAEVSEGPDQANDRDILAVYNRWTRSNSGRLGRMLKRFGINPVVNNSKLQQ